MLDLTLTRRSIEVPTVEYRLITDKIGYISISEFDDVTDDQFIAALDDLKSQGMENLTIDLRDNGGGLVDVTCDILDQLLPEGMIVYTEDKDGEPSGRVLPMRNTTSPGKMAVLVNGNSASAFGDFCRSHQGLRSGNPDRNPDLWKRHRAESVPAKRWICD